MLETSTKNTFGFDFHLEISPFSPGKRIEARQSRYIHPQQRYFFQKNLMIFFLLLTVENFYHDS